MFTGRELWSGSEVYGSRLGSDELKADTERDLRRGAEWGRERVARSRTSPQLALR